MAAGIGGGRSTRSFGGGAQLSAEGAKIETPQAPREWGLGRGLHPPVD